MIELKTEIGNRPSVCDSLSGRIVIAVFISLSIALSVSAQTIISDVSYKTSGRTLKQACDDAGRNVLAISSAWARLDSQQLSCNIQMHPGGVIQPGPGQTVTISGSFASPDIKTLDTALGKAGSIAFTGPVVAHAEWFGARPGAAASENTLAIQSALYAFPVVKNGIAEGGIPMHEGAAQIGCGVFIVDNTIFMNAGMRWDFPCARLTTLRLADNSFTGPEKFMIQVLPTLISGNPTPNVTHSVVLSGGGLIDCNGAKNPGCSNLKFYGAENSSVKEFAFVGARQRGVAIGDICARDRFCGNTSDSIVFENNWVVGLGADSVGPGLYIRCTACSFPQTKAQYFNSAGSFTGAVAPGEPNPEIWIEGSNSLTTHDTYGECDSRFMEISNSRNLVFTNLFPGSRGMCPTKAAKLGIRISGVASNVIIGPGSATYFQNVLSDVSSGFGSGPYPTIPGGEATVTWPQYVSDAPRMGRGIDLFPNNSSTVGMTQIGTPGLTGAISVARPHGVPAGSGCWFFNLGSLGPDSNPTANITASNSDAGKCDAVGAQSYSFLSMSRGGTGAYSGYQTVLGDPNVPGGVTTGPATTFRTQGPLSIAGGIGWKVVTVKSNYTLLNEDGTVFCDTSAGGLTVTLPVPKIPGEMHYIKLVSSTNTLHFAAAGGHAIEVEQTSMKDSVYQFQYDGINTWRVVGRY